jgi:adenylate cyclase
MTEETQHRLAAILSADVVGYSRLMSVDEAGTHARLKSCFSEIFEPKLVEHHGRVVKLMGDGLLAEFSSAIDAVNWAVAVQNAVAELNAETPDNQRIDYRIGVNLGDVIVDNDDLFGDGVNVAARLQEISEPRGVCISQKVHAEITGKLPIEFEDGGNQELKNIDRAIHIYRWPANSTSRSQRIAPSLELPDKPSIVVFPFDNMSGDSSQNYFADGIVEAITSALANIRSFFVIARNTAFTYKGNPTDIREIGRELGVGYVLEGSVQKANQRIRITAQLIETENGTHVWAKRFDRALDVVFELQDQITEQVAGALQPSIQLAEIERVRRKRPQDLGAYDYTMQAFPHVWALEKEETVRALSFLELALEIDPDYPFALSLCAYCHAQRSLYNWNEDIEVSKSQALMLAEKAAEMSNDDPLVLSVLGTVHTIIRNLATARILLERAVSINPNSAWTWSRLGWLESIAKRPEPALEYFQKAQRLNPLDPHGFNTYVGIGTAYEGAGEYEIAVGYFKRALQERPHAYWVYRSLASVLVEIGRMEEAREAFDILMRHYPDLTLKDIHQAIAFSPQFKDKMIDNLATLGMAEE